VRMLAAIALARTCWTPRERAFRHSRPACQIFKSVLWQVHAAPARPHSAPRCGERMPPSLGRRRIAQVARRKNLAQRQFAPPSGRTAQPVRVCQALRGITMDHPRTWPHTPLCHSKVCSTAGRKLGAVRGAWLAKRRLARTASEPRKRSPPPPPAGGESGHRVLGAMRSRSEGKVTAMCAAGSPSRFPRACWWCSVAAAGNAGASTLACAAQGRRGGLPPPTLHCGMPKVRVCRPATTGFLHLWKGRP
jgi:hypothetical protein